MKRPNILFITTDQQRYDHLGLAGLRAVATPNLDRLGTEGMHCMRAYCTSPTCTPSRVSMLVGQYPSRHGGWSLGVSADPFPAPTLPELLAESGYATALLGKAHFVARPDEIRHITEQDNPSEEFWREFTGPYLGFQYVQTAKGHTINNIPGMHYKAFLEAAGVDYTPWFPKLHPDYDHHRCGSWEIPPEYHDTAWIGGLSERWIEDHVEGQPWFCWASFQDPHEPHVCPEPWFRRVDRSLVQPFEGIRKGEFDNKPGFYTRAARGDWNEFDDGYGVPSSFHFPLRDERAVDALQATLGMIAFIDHQVGRMLAALERTGQLENTIIIFTTDHGEMHGHHGFWGKGLTAYEDCQRVPLLIYGQRLVRRTGSNDALISQVDLPCTLLRAAGIVPPIGMQGMDLTPLLQGKQDRFREEVVVECRATSKVYQQTLITDRYKLIVYDHSNEGELYDLHADLDQYCNLWSPPENAKLRDSLLLRLVQNHMREEGRRNCRINFA